MQLQIDFFVVTVSTAIELDMENSKADMTEDVSTRKQDNGLYNEAFSKLDDISLSPDDESGEHKVQKTNNDDSNNNTKSETNDNHVKKDIEPIKAVSLVRLVRGSVNFFMLLFDTHRRELMQVADCLSCGKPPTLKHRDA
jgi:hypothetical protein